MIFRTIRKDENFEIQSLDPPLIDRMGGNFRHEKFGSAIPRFGDQRIEVEKSRRSEIARSSFFSEKHPDRSRDKGFSSGITENFAQDMTNARLTVRSDYADQFYIVLRIAVKRLSRFGFRPDHVIYDRQGNRAIEFLFGNNKLRPFPDRFSDVFSPVAVHPFATEEDRSVFRMIRSVAKRRDLFGQRPDRPDHARSFQQKLRIFVSHILPFFSFSVRAEKPQEISIRTARCFYSR